jgi:AcrR family transcriptional regulator
MTAAQPRTRRILHRDDLLRAVADHIRENGLHGFTLRQAAAAADTTHKVLLYHFGSANKLIVEAVDLIRAEMVAAGRSAVPTTGNAGLAERLETLLCYWRTAGGGSVMYEAIGLAMADPEEFGDLAKRATDEILAEMSHGIEPVVGAEAADTVATLLLALLRGLTIDRSVTADEARVDAAWTAFCAALTTALAPLPR